MQKIIEAKHYKLFSAQTEDGVVFVNEQPLSPLGARVLQHKLIADEDSRLITYRPPNEQIRSLFVSTRHFAILAELRSGTWVPIKELKKAGLETRKPVSELRTFGLIIETSPKLKAYRLKGEVDLYATGINSPKSILEFLPPIDESKQIEQEKAKFEIARRFSRINKYVDYLQSQQNSNL